MNTPDGGQALTILNADASGRKIISLPDDATVGNLNNALSPNGEWLAFHTMPDGTSSINLTLKLMHLPDGKITTVTKLLSKDFPANFDKSAALSIQTDSRYSRFSLGAASGVLQMIFMDGIRGVDWSPDSHYLAFAGEMDGPSSDLYVYDTQAMQIKRLTDGPSEMTGFIRWSPDGKWILHGSDNEPPGEGMRTDLYVVRSDGSGAKKIDTATPGQSQWISPRLILVNIHENVLGAHDLRMHNVETGERTTIWSGRFDDFAFDPLNSGFAVCGGGADPLDPGYLPEGLYLFQSNRPRQYIRTNYVCDSIFYRGSKSYEFIEGSPYGFKPLTYITYTGKWMTGQTSVRAFGTSPDYKWMLLGESSSKLDLYDETDTLIGEFQTDLPELVTWRPDSLGIYYLIGGSLYYLQIPGGKAILVDQGLPTHSSEFDYRWCE